MPGGTARLRVSGAIARRFGSVIGPSLKGSNSLVWLMSGMSAWMMIGNSWALRAILAIPEAIRLAQRSCAGSRPGGGEPWRRCVTQDDLFGIGSGAAWAASRATVRRPKHSGAAGRRAPRLPDRPAGVARSHCSERAFSAQAHGRLRRDARPLGVQLDGGPGDIPLPPVEGHA